MGRVEVREYFGRLWDLGVQPLNTKRGRWETKRACKIEKVQSRPERQLMARNGAQRGKPVDPFNRFIQVC